MMQKARIQTEGREHADSIWHAVLLGNPGTKRTAFFEQAAVQKGLPVFFIDWKDYSDPRQSDKWQACLETMQGRLKIDPPLWNSCLLRELPVLVSDYQTQLKRLSVCADSSRLQFLNHPDAIMQLLDKRLCKQTLVQAGLPVTEQLGSVHPDSAQMLLDMMHSKRVSQVFLKPVYGSGGAGVTAFRWQPSTGRMRLYTCAAIQPDEGLVNTKRLRCFCQPEEIFPLLNQLLKLGCLIERWHAKALYKDYSYDLRAVIQDGSLDFVLARLSKGPITNLHLNNHPCDVAALGLSKDVLESVHSVCKKAMGCFPGLRTAGIDLLLEKGNLQPRIIEMNAQGDLIYRDIYGENLIYRHQAAMMQQL